MDCRRMEQLISPYLDGELSSQEMALMKSHLAVCANCAQEYETMKRISLACCDMGKISVAAPTGFKDAVMQKIREEEEQAIKSTRRVGWLRPSIKQATAAVAAAAILALGTLGTNPIGQIAERVPVLNQIEDNSTQPGSSPNNNNPTSDLVPENNPIPGAAQKPETVTVATAPDVVGTAQPVFLNKERYIITTLLQVQVQDSSYALEQALSMTNQAGAQALNLGQQVNENGTYTVVKITVTNSAAGNLVVQLSSLGTVKGQEAQKNDITSLYAAALSQYQSLVTQQATWHDPLQKADLDQRIDNLSRDLLNWEKQAEQQTIVLWIEQFEK